MGLSKSIAAGIEDLRPLAVVVQPGGIDVGVGQNAALGIDDRQPNVLSGGECRDARGFGGVALRKRRLEDFAKQVRKVAKVAFGVGDLLAVHVANGRRRPRNGQHRHEDDEAAVKSPEDLRQFGVSAHGSVS